MQREDFNEVQRQFSTQPLFGTELTQELNSLEQYHSRYVHKHDMYPSNSRQPSVAASRSPSASHHYNASHYGPQDTAGNYNLDESGQLPPPPKRPWAVEQLLSRGEPLGGAMPPRQQAAHEHESSTASRAITPRADQVSNRSRSQPNSRGSHREVEFVEETPQTARRRRRRATHYSRRGQMAFDPPSASDETESDHDGPETVQDVLRREYVKRQEELEIERQMEIAEKMAKEDTVAALGTMVTEEAQRELDRRIEPDKMASHIERAAARRGMQHQRLSKFGEKPPGARVDGGCQTEESNVSRQPEGAERAPQVIQTQTSPHSTTPHDPRGPSSRSASYGPDGQPRHPSNKTPPIAGLLIQPAVPYRPISATNRRLAELEAMQLTNNWTAGSSVSGTTLDATPVPFSTSDMDRTAPAFSFETSNAISNVPMETLVSNAGGPIMSSATASSMLAHTPGSGFAPVDRAAASVLDDANAGMRSALMQKLDQVQLANEELLVRNEALDVHSSVLKEDKELADLRMNAVRHVGDANKVAADAHVPAPIGGYGSVSDRTQRTVLADEEPRWKAAQMRNDHEDAMHGGKNEPIRSWAASSLPNSQRDRMASDIPRGVLRDQYNARKKWANVSFTLPSEKMPPQFLEKFSSSAKEMMAPPR